MFLLPTFQFYYEVVLCFLVQIVFLLVMMYCIARRLFQHVIEKYQRVQDWFQKFFIYQFDHHLSIIYLNNGSSRSLLKNLDIGRSELNLSYLELKSLKTAPIILNKSHSDLKFHQLDQFISWYILLLTFFLTIIVSENCLEVLKRKTRWWLQNDAYTSSVIRK